jgi:hypothetical protein
MELRSRLAERITIAGAFIAKLMVIAMVIELKITDTASSSRTTLDSEQWP